MNHYPSKTPQSLIMIFPLTFPLPLPYLSMNLQTSQLSSPSTAPKTVCFPSRPLWVPKVTKN